MELLTCLFLQLYGVYWTRLPSFVFNSLHQENNFSSSKQIIKVFITLLWMMEVFIWYYFRCWFFFFFQNNILFQDQTKNCLIFLSCDWFYFTIYSINKCNPMMHCTKTWFYSAGTRPFLQSVAAIGSCL